MCLCMIYVCSICGVSVCVWMMWGVYIDYTVCVCVYVCMGSLCVPMCMYGVCVYMYGVCVYVRVVSVCVSMYVCRMG